jgi:hypothetical protein
MSRLSEDLLGLMAIRLPVSQQMSLTHFVVLSSLTLGAMRLLLGVRHQTPQV